MGTRRIGWNALIAVALRRLAVLAIAALVGVIAGDTLADLLAEAPAAPAHAPAAPQAAVVVAMPAPPVSPAARVVVTLAIDGRARLDGGEPLGDAAGLARALRGAGGEIIVAPHAGVPWLAVVDFIDLVRRVAGDGAIVRLDAPHE